MSNRILVTALLLLTLSSAPPAGADAHVYPCIETHHDGYEHRTVHTKHGKRRQVRSVTRVDRTCTIKYTGPWHLRRVAR